MQATTSVTTKREKSLRNKVAYVNAKLNQKEEEITKVKAEANLLKSQHLDKDYVAAKLHDQVLAEQSVAAKLSNTLTVRTGRFTSALAKNKSKHEKEKKELVAKVTESAAEAKKEKDAAVALAKKVKLEKAKRLQEVQHVKLDTEEWTKEQMRDKQKVKLASEKERSDKRLARSSRAHRASYQTLKVS